ncbi:hypothetical protein DQG23_29675 [Paenibacillus contaminans]|uniref:Uncharacterized protein n=1 Tax=Paenibacillus contaminans TaxID=450362 RepID=A0A329M6I5_9BACL|nr:hypothetical protein DQG23_29675 [Paenibacillus contaminans]
MELTERFAQAFVGRSHGIVKNASNTTIVEMEASFFMHDVGTKISKLRLIPPNGRHVEQQEFPGCAWPMFMRVSQKGILK